MEIEAGKVVRLKSGGCDMTVIDSVNRYCNRTGSKYNEISVVWHDDGFNFHQIDIDSVCVNLLEDKI